MQTAFRVPTRLAIAVITVSALVIVGAPATATRTKAAAKESFKQTNLVSDQPGVALITDANLEIRGASA